MVHGFLQGHKVRILPYSTFRLNLSVTSPYNADFDGDEMNMHVPQTAEARAETKEIMMVPRNIVSAQVSCQYILPVLCTISTLVATAFCKQMIMPGKCLHPAHRASVILLATRSWRYVVPLQSCCIALQALEFSPICQLRVCRHGMVHAYCLARCSHVIPQLWLQANKPVIGIVQDTLLGCRLMTKRDSFIKKDLFMNILMWLEDWDGRVPMPAVLKPEPLWTGKQVVNLIIPRVNLRRKAAWAKDQEDQDMTPWDSQVHPASFPLLVFVLCQASLGLLIHHIVSQ